MVRELRSKTSPEFTRRTEFFPSPSENQKNISHLFPTDFRSVTTELYLHVLNTGLTCTVNFLGQDAESWFDRVLASEVGPQL